MGGYVPLSYEIKERKLLVIENDAAIVRRIFQRFVEPRSVTELSRELVAEGITTKPTRLREGGTRNGTPMDKKYLSKMQRNPIYVGEIRHKGTSYAGQHEPIISRQLWDLVQEILAENAYARMGVTQTRGKTDALLRGLPYDMNGVKYHVTFSTQASGKRYRCYIPKVDKRYGYLTSATGAIPADQIEVVVVNLVLQALRSPESMQAVWNHVRAQYAEIAEPTVALAMRRLAEVWKA